MWPSVRRIKAASRELPYFAWPVILCHATGHHYSLPHQTLGLCPPQALMQVPAPTDATAVPLVAAPLLVSKPQPSGAPGTPEQPVEAPTTPGAAAI